MPARSRYDDFLLGVRSADWIFQKSRSADEEFGKSLGWGKDREEPRSSSYRAGYIACSIVSALFVLSMLIVGSLLLAGAIVFTATVIVPEATPPSPPPPSPPKPPPHPEAPPEMMTFRESTCVLTTASIAVSAVGNGVCQDGGDGSATDECALGTDYPDCPVRFATMPPSSPPAPLPPGADRVDSVTFEFVSTVRSPSAPPTIPPPSTPPPMLPPSPPPPPCPYSPSPDPPPPPSPKPPEPSPPPSPPPPPAPPSAPPSQPAMPEIAVPLPYRYMGVLSTGYFDNGGTATSLYFVHPDVTRDFNAEGGAVNDGWSGIGMSPVFYFVNASTHSSSLEVARNFCAQRCKDVNEGTNGMTGGWRVLATGRFVPRTDADLIAAQLPMHCNSYEVFDGAGVTFDGRSDYYSCAFRHMDGVGHGDIQVQTGLFGGIQPPAYTDSMLYLPGELSMTYVGPTLAADAASMHYIMLDAVPAVPTDSFAYNDILQYNHYDNLDGTQMASVLKRSLGDFENDQAFTDFCFRRCFDINEGSPGFPNGWQSSNSDGSSAGPTALKCVAFASFKFEHATNADLQTRRCHFYNENLQTTWHTWLQPLNSFTTYHGTYSMLAFPAMTNAPNSVTHGGRRLSTVDVDAIKVAVVAQLGNGITADDVTVTLNGDQVLVTVSVSQQTGSTKNVLEIASSDGFAESVASNLGTHTLNVSVAARAESGELVLATPPSPAGPPSPPTAPPPSLSPSPPGPSPPPWQPHPSPPPPNPPEHPSRVQCTDSCTLLIPGSEFGYNDLTRNGRCDDGLEGSETSLCFRGTDCTDCGVRVWRPPPHMPPAAPPNPPLAPKPLPPPSALPCPPPPPSPLPLTPPLQPPLPSPPPPPCSPPSPLPSPPVPPAPPPVYEWSSCGSRHFDPENSGVHDKLPTLEECIQYRDDFFFGAELFDLRKFSTAKRGACFFLSLSHPQFSNLVTREGGEWRILRDQVVANGLGGSNGWSDTDLLQDRSAVWPDIGQDVHDPSASDAERLPIPNVDELVYQTQTPSWPHFQAISVLLYKHHGPEVFTGVSDCDRGTIRSAASLSDLPKDRAPYDISVEFLCDGHGDSIQTLWFYGSASASSAMGLQIDTTQNNFNHYWYGADITWSWGNDNLVYEHNICDGLFHKVRVTYAGNSGERKFYFDGVERTPSVSVVGDGTHADRNDNFCLGAEAEVAMGGRGGQPFFGTLKNLQVYGGIRTTETTEEQMIRQVRQAPAVQMCEDDSRCRVGQFRLCVDCPGSDNSNRLTNTIRYIGVGAVIGEPSTADPPPNMEPFVKPPSTENVLQCYETYDAVGITQSSSSGPDGTGGFDVAGGSPAPVSTTNTRHPACVAGWHGGRQQLAEDLNCEFSMASGSSTETYRRYAFARESWSIKDATWISRASTPDSCSATSQRPGRAQGPISSNPQCTTAGWTWTTDTFDCSQVYNGGFDACFRTSAFRQHSVPASAAPTTCAAIADRYECCNHFESVESGAADACVPAESGQTYSDGSVCKTQSSIGGEASTAAQCPSLNSVNGACGPSNWYHDFDTWQCDGCGGQNAGITLDWDTPIPKVNAFKWAQLCETLDAAAACVDRVQVRIVHSGGTTTEKVENLQCLNSDDIPNGRDPECTGPFRTRFEERDWKQFNFLSGTFTSVTSMTFTLASTSATSANGGHAGVQEIEVGYAARPKTIQNSLGGVFWLPEDQAQHYCSQEVGFAAARGVSTDDNPAQCTVTPRAYQSSGLPVSDADQLDFRLNAQRPSDTRDYFDSGGDMFGFRNYITEDTATFQISNECWQSVGSPAGFHNIKLTKVIVDASGSRRQQVYYLPVHMSGPIGPDRYSTVLPDGSVTHNGVPGGAILAKNYNRLWGGASIAGTSNVFVEGDVVEFYPAMANGGKGYDCKCIEYYASPPPPPLPPPSMPPQPQLPPQPKSPPPPFPPGDGCPRVRFRHLGQVTKTFQQQNTDPTELACQGREDNMHDDGLHTIWDAAQLATTRLPVCGEGLTVAFEFWLDPDPGANANWAYNPVLTFGDYDAGFFLYGQATGPNFENGNTQPVKDFQIHDNMNEADDGERWVDGMGTFAAGWKKSVLRVQQTGGYTFEVEGTTVMSGAQTFCTNNQKLCILGLNKYGELGGGSMRNLEVYAGGNVNSECFWINHQGAGPRAEWAANQDWAPGVDYLDPHRASDPVVVAEASATYVNPFTAESVATYNQYLAAGSAVQSDVASTEGALAGYSLVGTGMCHDEPATSAQYRFRESDPNNPDICRSKCAQLNSGLLTDNRYVNASDHCEAYEVHSSGCHWYAPPAGHHVMVTSLETVGAHTYYGTADNPMRCYAAAVPSPPPSPPKPPARPPALPITEDIFAIVEELSPFDTEYRYSVNPRRILHNATLTPLECLLACRADAQCDYVAWLRSDCQASGVGNRCVLGVYNSSTTATLPKHECYTEGAFRHFVFNTSRVCDSNYAETGARTCPENLPYCLGQFAYGVGPSLVQQYVGACFAEYTDNPRVPKPPPAINGLCRNTCLSPTPNNRGEWLPSASHIGNGVCDDGGLDAKAFGDPAAFACAYGTDCADCGVRPPLPVPLAPIHLCTYTCTGYDYYHYDRDGDNVTDAVPCRDSYADRPRMVWEDDSERPFTGYCGYGTDCGYCNVRQAQGVVTQAFDVPAPRVESLTDWVSVRYKAPVLGTTASVSAETVTATASHSHAPHSHAPHSHAPTHGHSPSLY